MTYKHYGNLVDLLLGRLKQSLWLVQELLQRILAYLDFSKSKKKKKCKINKMKKMKKREKKKKKKKQTFVNS